MFSNLNIQSSYFHISNEVKLLFLICALLCTAPAWAQTNSANHLCNLYEQHLRATDYKIALNARQSARARQIMHMQHQANSDAKRFSCHDGIFSKGSVSEQCNYIRGAQKRLESALQQISHQAATPKQRRIKHAIYKDMHQSNCRNPQSLEQLIQKNRQVSPAKVRKRIQQNYNKQKPVQQVVLQQPAIIQVTPKMSEPQERIPIKAVISYNPLFSTPPTPNMQTEKAAENSPPPISSKSALSEPVDYIPDQTIRRVGPAYYPAQ
ncbi:hypothetical protein [Pseudochrobactrum sp. MP213Fo]|uniref:hypothetical protein n=1 Tax=Pseudochrobactrum sp. MP213Fo TaxID=3022250 RepID=UPI003B9F4ED6